MKWPQAGKRYAVRQDLNPEADKLERNESLANLAAIWRKPSSVISGGIKCSYDLDTR
jgi:hypothetical protein